MADYNNYDSNSSQQFGYGAPAPMPEKKDSQLLP